MASRRLGSKSDVFRREGETWFCRTGLPSDIIVKIGEVSFHLHKFPLLSRSGLLEELIEESSFYTKNGSVCILPLDNLPGGNAAFELIAKFCYGVVVELNALNVVMLRCAAEHLRMTEDYGERNLIAQTEAFFSEIFGNWADSIIALKTCEDVLSCAEDLHIVSRCIDSLAVKACSDSSLFHVTILESNKLSPARASTSLWNGIFASGKPKAGGDDWWHEDVNFLSLPIYKSLIMAIESRGMKPENLAASLLYYAKRHIPIFSGQGSFEETNKDDSISAIVTLAEDDKRVLLEEIVGLLPNRKGVISTKDLLKLLLTAMILRASPLCRENLERRVGTQLEQASLTDVLVPNIDHSESRYDIDCVLRIVDYFVSANTGSMAATSSSSKVEKGESASGTSSPTPMAIVATLVDRILAEVAPDVNLKLSKFKTLAALIPDYARPVSDGIYYAVDLYLKAHPWLTESEREQLCRLLDFQKLSLEASTHAAQNERLPLRVLVQVVFFEQLRFRTSISGKSDGSENFEHSQNLGENVGLLRLDGSIQMGPELVTGMDVRQRVFELQRECLSMKQELRKLAKTKRSWNIFTKKSCIKQTSQVFNPIDSKLFACRAPILPMNRGKSRENGERAIELKQSGQQSLPVS